MPNTWVNWEENISSIDTKQSIIHSHSFSVHHSIMIKLTMQGYTIPHSQMYNVIFKQRYFSWQKYN